MKQKHCLARQEGMTLIELIVVMGIFIVVIIITSKAFNTVLLQTKKVAKSEESNIEGVIGLEMFRHDLLQAGFGLFTEIDTTPPSYDEAVGTREAAYNDSTRGIIPRAVVAGNNITGDAGVLDNSDYIVIKATTVSRSSASQKWTYINGISTPAMVWGANDFDSSKDYVIATRQTYKSGELRRKLVYNTAAPSSLSVKYRSTAGLYADPFGPPSDAVQYYYYGIYSNDGSAPPRAPFNRTDYVVKRTSDTPRSCAPGAGVLYKRTMSQTDGTMDDIPILDCVADMQVVFGWNTESTGGPYLSQDTATNLPIYTNADLTTTSTSLPWKPSLDDPTDLRKHLKLIKVYVLAQDGGKDLNYTNTNTAMPVGVVGEANTLAHSIDLTGPNYQNYRWKLYRIVAQPKNLL
jgi:type II secretory pathway pseudopilin PulG